MPGGLLYNSMPAFPQATHIGHGTQLHNTSFTISLRYSVSLQ